MFERTIEAVRDKASAVNDWTPGSPGPLMLMWIVIAGVAGVEMSMWSSVTIGASVTAIGFGLMAVSDSSPDLFDFLPYTNGYGPMMVMWISIGAVSGMMIEGASPVVFASVIFSFFGFGLMILEDIMKDKESITGRVQVS
jgi:hypothetical protein